MTEPTPPYFRAPPLPIDIERDRRLGLISDFQARIAGIALGFHGRRVQAYESMTLGGMIMVADPVWIREDDRWHQWRRFGHDGWLMVASLPGDAAPPRSASHAFASAGALFAHEQALRQTGLTLTADYARRRDAALRVAPPAPKP